MPRRRLWLALALGAATIAVYAPVRRYAFVNYDDDEYVAANVDVRRGLSASGIAWAFTDTRGANWLPLTRLSWLADHQLHGLDAGRFHVTNVALHVASTLVLFTVLAGATGSSGRAAFVAGVFALHPLHVESVAWISERKDVLCGLMWMLATGAYVSYTARPTPRDAATWPSPRSPPSRCWPSPWLSLCPWSSCCWTSGR
jgi:protein O-mannosyl-transferase